LRNALHIIRNSIPALITPSRRACSNFSVRQAKPGKGEWNLPETFR
jgi:hypothetical protein